MDTYLRKYFWVMTLLVILICAYFLARAVVFGALGFVPVPKSSVRSMRSLATTARAPNRRHIAERNMFCSECEPVVVNPLKAAAKNGDPKAAAAAANGDLTKSDLKLTLIATLISDDKDWCFATLTDQENEKTGMFRIGSKLPGGGELADILTSRILIQRNGRTEFIEFEQGKPKRRAPPKVKKSRRKRRPRSKLAEQFGAGVKQLGPTRWEIQRAALNKVLGNTTGLARSARIVPSVKNGKPNGFKLYAVRPGSVYSLIGMKNGDTIHKINGASMATPDQALQVYTKVRSASHLTINFTRGGKSVTHDYVIR